MCYGIRGVHWQTGPQPAASNHEVVERQSILWMLVPLRWRVRVELHGSILIVMWGGMMIPEIDAKSPKKGDEEHPADDISYDLAEHITASDSFDYFIIVFKSHGDRSVTW